MDDLIQNQRIEKYILLLRGQKVILDRDLAYQTSVGSTADRVHWETEP